MDLYSITFKFFIFPINFNLFTVENFNLFIHIYFDLFIHFDVNHKTKILKIQRQYTYISNMIFIKMFIRQENKNVRVNWP